MFGKTGDQNPHFGVPCSDATKQKISNANKGKLAGEKSPNFGKSPSLETREKMRLSHLGKRSSKESNEKRRASLKKVPRTEEWCKKISNSQKGKVIPLEQRDKISKSLTGKYTKERSATWKGGASFEPYCPKFNKEFKERVRTFFGRVCVECGKTQEANGERLTVHHVNFDKMTCCNDVKPLFVSLCRACHAKTNHNRSYWENHFTNLIMLKFKGKCYEEKS